MLSSRLAVASSPVPEQSAMSPAPTSTTEPPPPPDEDVIVTTAVSASDPPLCFAITRNVPVVFPAVYSPLELIVPPVADQVTLIATESPALVRPEAPNCCVAPTASVTEAGTITSCTTGGAVIVTVAVSARVPPVCFAITRNVPVAVPAVYNPVDVIVPPLADQVTATGTESPALERPYTTNCCVVPAGMLAVAGTTINWAGGGGGPIVIVAVSARPCATAITRNGPAVCPAVYSPPG